MSALLLTVFLPLVGVAVLAWMRRLSWAGWLNVAVCTATFAAAAVLAWQVARGGEVAGMSFRVDAFNVYLLVLTAFVGMTTSIFSRPYMRYVCETGKTTERGMRLYHAMYQAFMFTMLLALSTDNL
ncbi:MAG: hydrogenase 4 subunit F, partial [Thioalkalispiraceae bacterium]